MIDIKTELTRVNDGFLTMEKKVNDQFHVLREEIELDRQYSRRSSILIHGFRDLPKLSNFDFVRATAGQLNILFPSFGGRFTMSDIDACHPLQPMNKNSPKMVLIRFKNRWLKLEIMKRYGGRIHGTPYSVSEHLTAYTRGLKDEAIKIAGKQNVSIDEGIVYAYIGGKSYPIKYSTDLDRLDDVIIKFKTNTDKISDNDSAPSSSSSSTNDNSTPPVTGANLVPLGTKNSPSTAHYLPSKTFSPRGRPSHIGRGRGRGRRDSDLF